MPIAIISDIHGNLEALNEVLTYINAQNDIETSIVWEILSDMVQIPMNVLKL